MGVYLATVDLPQDQGGPSTGDILKYGSDNHVSVDINREDLENLAEYITDAGKFDVIVATEVIEHLQRDFSEIARWLLKCLNPGGTIVVTTPNANRQEKLSKTLREENCQSRFMNFNANRGGHHHFREYTMSELVDDIGANDGNVFGQIYSHCFFDDELLPEPQYHLRTNMVVVFGHDGDDCW